MILIKCTCDDPKFCTEIIDLQSEFPITVETYDSRYFDTKKKGYLKCKSAFAAKKDPFVGIWKDGIPMKGFYSEANECTIDNVKQYLSNLQNEDFEARQDEVGSDDA